MNSKERFIQLLLRTYPSAWRAEYGEELASTLLRRPLGFAAIADVAMNALWQRLKSDAPWKICGAAAALWLLLCIVANTIEPLPDSMYNYVLWPNLLMGLAVGCWTVFRERKGIFHATIASLKASFVWVAPVFVVALLWNLHLLHPVPTDGYALLIMRGDKPVSPPELLLTLATMPAIEGLRMGFIGAVLGRGAAEITRRLGAA